MISHSLLEPVLVLSDSHGIYIPQMWCSDLDQDQAEKLGLNWRDVKQCQDGPDAEFYWEAWDCILSACEVTDDHGITWRLYQDGDLWEVADGYQWPDL